ncbi:MAG: exonuclease V subunit gamma, partial [Actinomycetales bacterium]
DRVPTWGTRQARAEVDPPETGNTLLTTCARDAAELEIGLLGLEVDLEVEHLEPPARPSSLLGLLQSDLVADRPAQPGEPSERQVAADDRSVQVHACHGAARQVDVLREVVLGLLEDDPTLEPRDVLVMCPDVETFAPLIQAAFGLDDVEGVEHPGHQLRVRLADRATGAVNPVAEVLQRLVSVAAGGRTTATEVRDLLGLAPVRHRFGLTDDDLEQVGAWITATGVRWGVDAEARSPWGLGGLAQNTWAAGLDRLALSVATEPGLPGSGSRLGGVLPVDDLGSSAVELVGRLTEAVSRLESVLAAGTGRLHVGQWVSLLSEAVHALTSTPARDAWQTDQVLRALAGLTAEDPSQHPGGTLGIVEVEAVLADLFAPRPTRTSFRTGSLTVCTMVPMRSVPHRVVCLLGLDADAFPRTPTPLGDDVLARHPLVGERDAAGEDRQLFLDAILSATEHLVITYTGASEHTGRELPPATPVGELLDQLERTAPSFDVRRHVLTHHPLQAFDARSFTSGAIVPSGPFSFDTAALAGARTTQRPAAPAEPFLVASLPSASHDVVTLDQLRAFVAHPVRSFVRGVLDVTLQHDADPSDDAIPLGLDPLEQWQLNERIL